LTDITKFPLLKARLRWWSTRPGHPTVPGTVELCTLFTPCSNCFST
jgi:hypothetical protein